MAGIGFRLQRLLAEDSYTASLKAYGYAALITAGPFLLTVALLAGLHRITLEELTRFDQAYLKAMITYAFAASLIAAGPGCLVLTRYAADEHYRGHVTHFAAVFLSAVALHGLVFAPPVLLFLSRLSIPGSAKLAWLLLFMSISGMWYALVFLSAARDYARVGWSVLAGALASAASAWLLGRGSGLPGYLAGFMLGQALTLLLFAWALVAEFGHEEAPARHWLAYFRRHAPLAGIGLLYNAGIWVDKFVFWNSLESEPLDWMLRHCPVYDAPMFFAYLTAVPSLVFFMVRMETEFFGKYRAYYLGIERREPLPTLEERRLQMVGSLRSNLRLLLLVQGVASWAALISVGWITQAAGMDPSQMGVLRTGIFAAFLQAGLIVVLNLLLYFDFQRETLACSALFFALNLLLSLLSTRGGLPAFGYGYAASCFLALAAALYFLNVRVAGLHFHTFMRQPIVPPVLVNEELLEDDPLADPAPE